MKITYVNPDGLPKKSGEFPNRYRFVFVESPSVPGPLVEFQAIAVAGN